MFNLTHVIINVSGTRFQAATGPLSDFVMFIVAIVFVLAKYEDKATRGV